MNMPNRARGAYLLAHTGRVNSPQAARTPFSALGAADLSVDHVYESGRSGNISDEPLAKLIAGAGNQGGFRVVRSGKQARLAVLFSTGGHPDWPDELDVTTGRYTYFGDNRSPGRDIHATRRGGNRLLAEVFPGIHTSRSARQAVPPFFLFESTGEWRDVRFRGVLAPGGPGTSPDSELFAVWRSKSGSRFQNYRATFTVLDIPVAPRSWIKACLLGAPLSATCPDPWRDWVSSGAYAPLTAPPTSVIRSKQDQQPIDAQGRSLVAAVYSHFSPQPTAFERFAADLFQQSDPRVSRIDVTRPWRDGGRDAVGHLLLGPSADPVAVEFALEAKCYAPTTGVGVKEMSRLISRLRHRQFGVLVTTSHVDRQAYAEVRDDGHPVVIIAARDIVTLLRVAHLDDLATLRNHLTRTYPVSASS